jgi:hypothetical protein
MPTNFSLNLAQLVRGLQFQRPGGSWVSNVVRWQLMQAIYWVHIDL